MDVTEVVPEANAAIELAPPPEQLINPFTGEVISLAGIDELKIVDFVAAVSEQKRSYDENFNIMLTGAKKVLEGRMRQSGARAIAHPQFVVELEDEHAPYAFDLETLKAAQKLLPEAEAAKVVKHVPGYQPPPVPATDKPGLPVSISALIRKYGEKSAVGDLLSRGMTRAFLGTRFVFKQRKDAPKIEGATDA